MSIEWACEVCKAAPHHPCVNTIDPSVPLVGRVEHLARALPKDGRSGTDTADRPKSRQRGSQAGNRDATP